MNGLAKSLDYGLLGEISGTNRPGRSLDHRLPGDICLV